MVGRTALWISLLLMASSGCAPDMSEQPRYGPLARSDFFPDERSARPLPTGVVPQEAAVTSAQESRLAQLKRGRERYDIFCSPCHGRVGDGAGMVVQRGFSRPPSLHLPRLRSASDEQLEAVISHGFGAMYSYENRVATHDRPLVVDYIRALQLSQSASTSDIPSDLPPQQRRSLEEAK